MVCSVRPKKKKINKNMDAHSWGIEELGLNRSGENALDYDHYVLL